MLEKKCLPNMSLQLINIEQNEYFIFNREKFSNIIGCFTLGIASCSCLIISINKDDLFLFTHIDESSQIEDIIINHFIPNVPIETLKTITFFYTKGINSLKNLEKEKKINNIKLIIENKFSVKINTKIKEHGSDVSCAKFVSYFGNSDSFIEFLKNFKIKSMMNILKRATILKNFIESNKKEFIDSIDLEIKLILYCDLKSIDALCHKYGIIFEYN